MGGAGGGYLTGGQTGGGHCCTAYGGQGFNNGMVGGDGTLSNITIGGDAGEFTAVSPGQGISSSLTNKTSNQQVSLGNGGSSDNAKTKTTSIKKKISRINHLLMRDPSLLSVTINIGNEIKVGQHCFGCTAGQGSSCSGALKN